MWGLVAFVYYGAGLSSNLIVGLIPQDLPNNGGVYAGRLILLLLGKFGASCAFATLYVFTSELFPTSIRTSAIGTCSIVSRLFTMAAPFVSSYLPKLTNNSVPFYLFGGAGLLASFLSCFVPETLGHKLPDSLDDARVMAEN